MNTIPKVNMEHTGQSAETRRNYERAKLYTYPFICFGGLLAIGGFVWVALVMNNHFAHHDMQAWPVRFYIAVSIVIIGTLMAMIPEMVLRQKYKSVLVRPLLVGPAVGPAVYGSVAAMPGRADIYGVGPVAPAAAVQPVSRIWAPPQCGKSDYQSRGPAP